MEFYYDLVPKNQVKSIFWRTVIILFALLLVGAYIWIAIKEPKPSTYFNVIIWTVWSALMIYQSFTGKSIDAFFGKKFIHITDKSITLKPKIFGKATTIDWDNLESVKMKPTYLVVKSKSGDKINIDFKEIDYLAVQDLKSIVKTVLEKRKAELEE